MRRVACSACGETDLEVFLNLGETPVADAYTEKATESDLYPLELAVCGKCRLVQLLEVLDDTTLFGTGYSFYSSASRPLSTYHREYACNIARDFPELVNGLIVEIGCNDGDMLRHFERAQRIGVDPAAGPVAAARERGLTVREQSFTSIVADEIVSDHGHASIIVANHVLAHVANVYDVLHGIKKLLAVNGVAFVEVQYLPDLLVNNAFDLVYHEHRNFFSLTSLAAVARRVDLHVMDVELTQRQGGSIRVTLTHDSALRSRSMGVEFTSTTENWLHDWGAYAGFQGRVDRVKTRLLGALFDDRLPSPIVGYGAPAKATTLLNYCGITSHIVPYVIDTTVAKQDRFIPGVNVPIRAHSIRAHLNTDVGSYLLLAWNYASEIMARNTWFTDRGGRWIIPIPAPVVL